MSQHLEIKDALEWRYSEEKHQLFWRDRLIATISDSKADIGFGLEDCYIVNFGNPEINMPLYMSCPLESAKRRTVEFWSEDYEFFQCYLPKKHLDFVIEKATKEDWNWDVVIRRALEFYQLNTLELSDDRPKFADYMKKGNMVQLEHMKNNPAEENTDCHGGTIKRTEGEAVHHPKHYNSGKIEVIDFIDDQKLGFALGNTIKYICRADHKGTKIQDLEKAAWYLNHEIEKLKEKV